jgi:hypothetical protein
MALGELVDPGAFDSLNEDRGAIHAVDVANIVTKEDAPERREGAKQVGFLGNGCLDVIDVLGGV